MRSFPGSSGRHSESKVEQLCRALGTVPAMTLVLCAEKAIFNTGERIYFSMTGHRERDYVPGLLCIRDMEGDAKAFAAMDMTFSTPSAGGQEIHLSNR